MALYHQVARSADTDAADGERAETVVHHFWVQELDCTGFQRTLHAHPTWQLAADPSAGTQHVLCRHCAKILHGR